MWHDVQLPKDLLAWIERHPGLASWLEALGVIGALFITLYIAGVDRRERARERRLRAQSLGLLLHTQLHAFRGAVERAIEAGAYSRAAIWPPAALVEHTDQLYLLGSAGGALLQMISTLNANETFVLEALQLQASNTDVWPGIRFSLDAALTCCNEAIREIDRLLSVDDLMRR